MNYVHIYNTRNTMVNNNMNYVFTLLLQRYFVVYSCNYLNS